MNGKFIFGGDRFGPGQDYYATYRALGGAHLTPGAVRRVVDNCYGRMAALYEDCGHIDSFLQVREVLAQSPAGTGLPDAEIELVEAVFARRRPRPRTRTWRTSCPRRRATRSWSG
jgi:putative hydrolase of the HAD superfamily